MLFRLRERQVEERPGKPGTQPLGVELVSIPSEDKEAVGKNRVKPGFLVHREEDLRGSVPVHISGEDLPGIVLAVPIEEHEPKALPFQGDNRQSLTALRPRLSEHEVEERPRGIGACILDSEGCGVPRIADFSAAIEKRYPIR